MSSDEKAIADANTGQFIQDATETDLRGLLAYCFSLTGLNAEAIPKEAANAVLIDFIRTNYSTFRIPEVRTAFQMNAAGRFGEVIEHFQNFSAPYFGKVMAAFRKKSQELKSYQETAKSWNEPVKPLHRSDEIPDEEMVNLSFQNYQKKGTWQYIYPGCYKTLQKHGLGLSFDEGAEQRAIFNRMKESERRGTIPEDTETQFRKFLTARVFTKLIQDGKTDFKL